MNTTAWSLLDLLAPVQRFGPTQVLEFLSMLEGDKPAVRLVLNDTEYATLASVSRTQGFHVEHTRTRLREVHDSNGDIYPVNIDWSDAGGGPFAAFVSLDHTYARFLADAESTDSSSQAIGIALGLPACCVEAYTRIQAGATWLEIWASAEGDPYDPAANHLASMVTGLSPAGEYLPCSTRCAETASRARLGAARARAAGLGEVIDEWWRWACCDVLVMAQTALVVSPPSGQPFFVLGDSSARVERLIAEGATRLESLGHYLNFAAAARACEGPP